MQAAGVEVEVEEGVKNYARRTSEEGRGSVAWDSLVSEAEILTSPETPHAVSYKTVEVGACHAKVEDIYPGESLECILCRGVLLNAL